jgi:thioredoxin 1
MAAVITDANFDEVVLKATTPVLLDMWAPWCGPCRAIGPVVEELAAEYEGKAVVGKMNVDDSSETPRKYGVRAIPTLFVFKNGEVVDQVTGAVSKANI